MPDGNGSIAEPAVAGAVHQRWTLFQVRTLALCAAVLFCDGFDLLAISYAAPALRQHFGLSAPEMGLVFSMGVLGTIIGGVFLGPIADRIGAKPVMVTSIMLAGFATIATTIASSFQVLCLLRVVTGIGLGGALPVTYAIACDYAPPKHRRAILASVAIGAPLGGAAAGLFWITLSSQLGWQSLFWCGGLMSIAATVAVWYSAPEALSYLRSHGHIDRLKEFSARLPRNIVIQTEAESERKAAGPGILLSRHWRFLTLGLWISSFLSIFAYYLVANWLPSAAMMSKSTAGVGASALAALQIGITMGGLAVGIAMDHFNGYRLISIAAIVAAATAALSTTISTPMIFVLLAGGIGFFSSCAQGGMNFVATTVFAAEVRSTSVAWTVSAGRVGGVTGPMVGSLLVGGPHAVTELMRVAAAAFLLCGMLMLIVALVRKDWR